MAVILKANIYYHLDFKNEMKRISTCIERGDFFLKVANERVTITNFMRYSNKTAKGCCMWGEKTLALFPDFTLGIRKIDWNGASSLRTTR